MSTAPAPVVNAIITKRQRSTGTRLEKWYEGLSHIPTAKLTGIATKKRKAVASAKESFWRIFLLRIVPDPHARAAPRERIYTSSLPESWNSTGKAPKEIK